MTNEETKAGNVLHTRQHCGVETCQPDSECYKVKSNNVLIAEFDGLKRMPDGRFEGLYEKGVGIFPEDKLGYDKYFNWFCPVWNRCVDAFFLWETENQTTIEFEQLRNRLDSVMEYKFEIELRYLLMVDIINFLNAQPKEK